MAKKTKGRRAKTTKDHKSSKRSIKNRTAEKSMMGTLGSMSRAI